ncbi:MAG: tyrosine--tRNA ligase [Acidimicrobiales bacterium]
MGELVDDLRFRGLIHQMTDPSLEMRLEEPPLCAYTGFDPQADSLHVGHLLQLCILRRLQLAGHRPILLGGGGTGFVGDPGGRREERTLLSEERLRANLEAIGSQLERFVELGGPDDASKGLFLDNAVWLRPFSLIDFLRDVGKHFTVNQMVAKESVRSRLDRPESGISYTEFSYMLLQAYDFLHLYDTFGCRLQLGGSDQWGNITMGIELVRRVRGAQVWGLTTPLVLKADGTKFAKSESGAVWLDSRKTSAYRLYQFFLRTDDADVGAYLRFFTFLAHEEILELDRATAARPERREAQRSLARQVCAMVHGPDDTRRAERAAEALFGEELVDLDESTLLDVFADAPSTTIDRHRMDDGGLTVVELLVETGLARSKSQARTTVGQGGASVNNHRIGDQDATVSRDDLVAERYLVLRRGRKEHHLVRFA